MVTYEEKIIDEFAARLYKQANSMVTTYTILGAGIGLIAGVAMAQIAGFVIGVLMLGFFGFIGYKMGIEKAFELKLKAQTALCQVKIEQNTRNNKE